MRIIFIGLGIVVLIAVGFYSYVTYQFAEGLGECGISAGPCFGQSTDLKLETELVDIYLDCPNGRIGFISTQDTLSPIIFKIDKTQKLLWALKLQTDSCCGIPMKKISGMEILEDDGIKRIHFFIQTYSEPGTISVLRSLGDIFFKHTSYQLPLGAWAN